MSYVSSHVELEALAGRHVPVAMCCYEKLASDAEGL